MFSIPIVKTKLIMPQNPHYFLNSSRIVTLCDSIRKTRVAEITAPPGYGKTSLVIAALKNHAANSRICWYRLDEQDVHMPQFYNHLIETLFPDDSEKYSTYRERFNEFGDIESQMPYINQLICSSLFECTKRQRQTKSYLIFDDFQTVADGKEIQTVIRWLIDNMPNNFSIIIISRTKSRLITEKQRLENDVLEIDYRALILEKDEIAELSKMIFKENNLDYQIISDMTEGWIAGVLLLLRARMKKLAENAKKQDLNYESVDASGFNYLTHELLENIDPALLDFLTGISILDEFSEESADYVLKIKNSIQYIKYCEKNGLFLQKTLGTAITYRFHSLFRNALLKIKDKRLSAETISQNHLTAAEYYCRLHDFGKAIEHYILASRIDLAADIISNAGRELASLEAMDKMRLIFDRLPRDVLEGNPGLMYMKSFLYQNGEEEAKRLLEKALGIFELAGIKEMELNTLFSLLAFYLFKNNAEEAISVLELAHRKAVEADEPGFDKLLAVIHFVKAVWEGEPEKADDILRLLNLEEIPPNYVWTVYMYSCIHYVLIGKLELAKNSIDSALSMAMVSQADMLKGFCLLFQSIISFYKNDSLQFKASIKSLLGITERYNVLYMLAFARVFSGFKEYRLNRIDEACTLLQMGIACFRQIDNQGLSSIFSLYLSLYQTNHGYKTEIYEMAQKSYETLTRTSSGFFFTEMGEMLLGAVAIEAGRLESAEELLLHAAQTSNEKNETLLLTTVYLHLANLYYKMERLGDFEKALRKAFFIASSNRYFVFTGVLTKTLVKLAALAVKHHIYYDYTHELIAENFGGIQADLFMQSLKQDDLHSFVEYFLSTCENNSTQRSHIINVNLLGPFRLQIDGITIPKSKFVTKKNESILKYLLFYKQKQISKEHLIELFWPESDKKSGFASIRTAIYGIRKIFTEYGLADVRDSFIVEGNGFLHIEHPEYIDSDVAQFLMLDKKQKSRTADEERIPLLEKLTNLYNGNLLEEGVFEEWAFFEREEYKTVYFNAVAVLSSLYIKSTHYRKAEKVLLKALSFDSYHEELSYLLLRNYLFMNQPERARVFYANYRDMLRRELDLEPGIKMRDLLRELK